MLASTRRWPSSPPCSTRSSPWSPSGFVAGLCAQLAKLSYDALVQRDVPEVVRTSVFARSETVFQICWVFGGALGISLPLIPPLGFGLVAAAALRAADLDDHRLA